MQALRALLSRRRYAALALVVLAFCIKALVPAGYMVSSSGASVLTVTICSDASSDHRLLEIAIPGKSKSPGEADDAGKGQHCAFAGLGHAALGGADGFLLALAFAFILLLGLAPARRLPFGAIAHLRPPLRGPPTAA